jgi:cell division protein FtsW (lipid II flippase)
MAEEIFAADTDMVFRCLMRGVGLIAAVLAVCALLALAFHAMHSSRTARSTYYVIGACAAAAILSFQMILNVLGSVDILPFTGVTFPFVSKGGRALSHAGAAGLYQGRRHAEKRQLCCQDAEALQQKGEESI